MIAQFCIRGFGDTSDWVVIRRNRDRTVSVSSRSLGTWLKVFESDLVPVIEASPLFLPLTVGGAVHGTPPTAAGAAGPPAACSVDTLQPPPEACRHPLPAAHDTPVARYTDPATAHNAARTASKTLTENQRRVLLAHADAGEAGLTGDEMAEVMGGEALYALLGPRRPQLERAGFLEKNGTRPNRRGNEVQVYRCTLSGFALARQWSRIPA